MAIEISQAAEADLLEIFLYSIEEFGLGQAERYKNRLENAFQALSDTPKMVRLRREISPPVRVHPVQQHLIIYTVLEDGETVYVLRVRHQREDWAEGPVD